MVNFDMRTESEPLEVKVPLLFSGTVGFPPPMEGRYSYSPADLSYLSDDQVTIESWRCELCLHAVKLLVYLSTLVYSPHLVA